MLKFGIKLENMILGISMVQPGGLPSPRPDSSPGGQKIRLFNKIYRDLLDALGEIQVYDRVRFEDVRETEIRKLFASSISLSN